MIKSEIFVMYALGSVLISLTIGIVFIVVREILDEYF